ncbi:MAG: hypothetical protein QNK19_04465 [Xanthomonadales bacterium]|nr:hypothetical protein [Xanthomonadales bacterium]
MEYLPLLGSAILKTSLADELMITRKKTPTLHQMSYKSLSGKAVGVFFLPCTFPMTTIDLLWHFILTPIIFLSINSAIGLLALWQLLRALYDVLGTQLKTPSNIVCNDRLARPIVRRGQRK